MEKKFKLLPDEEPSSDETENITESCLGLTRRTFLKGFGMTLAALSVPGASSAIPWHHRSRVAMVRSDDIEEMTRHAILLAGGLERIRSTETVFIKPNLVVPSDALGNRVTTHPEVLRAVIRTVKDQTATENITVGDRSAFTYPTSVVAERAGILQVCQEEGVNFLPLEEGNYINFTHPNFSHFKTPVAIPEVLSSFDHFINVPTCKNHTVYTVGQVKDDGLDFWIPPDSNLTDEDVLMYARFTMCMKNFVGLMPFQPENPESNCRVNSGLHNTDIGQKVAELNLCVPHITMNVIDCISALVENGPAGPDAVYTEPNLVIASKDRVACDSVGLALLKYYAKQAGVSPEDEPYLNESVWESPQIARARDLGLGHGSPSMIKLISRGVDEIDLIKNEWV